MSISNDGSCSTCRVCGRRLTDPESVVLGIGPVCAERLKRRRLRETQGLMKPSERVGWNYMKRCLAREGVDVDRLLKGTGTLEEITR